MPAEEVSTARPASALYQYLAAIIKRKLCDRAPGGSAATVARGFASLQSERGVAVFVGAVGLDNSGRFKFYFCMIWLGTLLFCVSEIPEPFQHKFLSHSWYRAFEGELEAAGVVPVLHVSSSGAPTATCACFVCACLHFETAMASPNCEVMLVRKIGHCLANLSPI